MFSDPNLDTPPVPVTLTLVSRALWPLSIEQYYFQQAAKCSLRRTGLTTGTWSFIPQATTVRGLRSICWTLDLVLADYARNKMWIVNLKCDSLPTKLRTEAFFIRQGMLQLVDLDNYVIYMYICKISTESGLCGTFDRKSSCKRNRTRGLRWILHKHLP